MAKKLLNVRLTEEDAQIVARLKARGVSMTALLRRALRTEDARASQQPIDTELLLSDILARYPTPPSEQARERPDATDRHAVKRYVQKRLRRGR